MGLVCWSGYPFVGFRGDCQFTYFHGGGSQRLVHWLADDFWWCGAADPCLAYRALDQLYFMVAQWFAVSCRGGYCLRSEEHTSELQSRGHLVCRLMLEKKKKNCL